MLGQASTPLLAQAEQGIVSKVPANLQDGLQRVVHAGLTIMYSPKLAQQRNARIAASTDPAQEAADGAARLMANLYQQSNKTLPVALVVPAAMVFAFEYLDLVIKAGKAQATPDLIAQATKATAAACLKLMGIGPQQMAALQAAHGQPPQAPQAAPPAAPAAPQGIIAQAQGGA